MQELVPLKVDVIVTTGRGAVAARRASDTIPIVALTDDPVALSLADSLAQPGHNLTGLTSTAGPAIEGKRLQLLKEAVPALARVAVIDHKYVDSKSTPGTHLRRDSIDSAARELGLTTFAVGVDRPEDFAVAFETIVRDGAEAVLVGGTSVNDIHLRRIIDFATRQRLPAIYEDRQAPESGGLMSYGSTWGSDPAAVWRRVAGYVDKILKGAKPADLPIEQPTKFELVINLKTARALGLKIPQSLLLQADALIE
jgi:putative ABC transport system substrate-binding protein